MIPIIVPARMSSRRLPGKPLLSVAGKPLLQRVIENLKHVDLISEIVVATSVDERDNPLASWCADNGYQCFRGPLDDVAERVIGAAKGNGAEAFVRVSGDSPLVDPELVSHAVRLYRAGEADLVTNVQSRTFPKGCSVEVVRTVILEDHLRRFATRDDREHVTTALYRESSQIRIVSFTSGVAAGGIQLSIDTAEDLKRVERILAMASNSAEPMTWRKAVELYTLLG